MSMDSAVLSQISHFYLLILLIIWFVYFFSLHVLRVIRLVQLTFTDPVIRFLLQLTFTERVIRLLNRWSCSTSNLTTLACRSVIVYQEMSRRDVGSQLLNCELVWEGVGHNSLGGYIKEAITAYPIRCWVLQPQERNLRENSGILSRAAIIIMKKRRLLLIKCTV